MRIVLGLVWAGAMALGTPIVYSTSALGEMSGSRTTTAGEIDAESVFATPITVSWDITFNAGIYHYQYTITGPTGSGLGVSHYALNLSNDCVDGGACVTNATVNGSSVQNMLVYDGNTSANGDPNFPGSFYGVRFFPVAQQLTIVVAFDSDHAPVYSDFYLKLGNGGPSNGHSAWNNGSEAPSNTSAFISDYVAGPGVAVGSQNPEPASFVLLGCGLAGLGVLRRRRK